MRMIAKIRKQIPNSLVNWMVHLPKAVLANVWYGSPARQLRVIGVTGTDGKTTTVNMIYRVLKQAGKKVSMVSTIHAEVAGKELDTGLHTTTPTAFSLQRLIRASVDHGDEFLVLEVTSHAIAQFRIWGVPMEYAVITNVTQEHLDYHKNFQEYFETKMKLLELAKTAVINLDEKNIADHSPKIRGKIISYGHTKNADFNPLTHELKLKVPGRHNLSNALAALAVCHDLGIKPREIKTALESFTSLEGRLEEVSSKNSYRLFVDFAHTPNSIKQVLTALKTMTKDGGQVIALFGASAERDEAKRPVMGKTAAELADVIILADDDPRFEDRMSIVKEIAAGATALGFKEGVNLFLIPDRDRAIAQAIQLARPGDVVGLLGKGHEKSMSYLGVEHPWSDRKVAEELLSDQQCSFRYS
jgi:UDP-N-acetylmuramoyl-L-alanyl-D-glutamate--2,6-diaminopimelate ligase